MPLPHLLLVDDSEAILAYEKATLGRLYTLTTALNGAEALERARAIRPDAILLDLSMPEMNGEEVLRRVRADPDLAHTPVVIVSSEHSRGEACVEAGATAFLPKPIAADDLRRARGARARGRRASGKSEQPRGALHRGGPARCGDPTRARPSHSASGRDSAAPFGADVSARVLHVPRGPVAILDLARRLRVAHSEPLIERRLVVLEIDSVRIAICVDRVRDPEEFEPENVVRAHALGGGEEGTMGDVIAGLVMTAFGPVPVIAPHALMNRKLLPRLGSMLEHAMRASGSAMEPDSRTRVSELP